MKEFTKGPDICIEGGPGLSHREDRVESWLKLPCGQVETAGEQLKWNWHCGQDKDFFFFSHGPVDTLDGSQMWFILEVSLQTDLPFKAKATQETMTGDVWKSWWGLIKSASECIAHNSDTFANWKSLTVSLKNLWVFPFEEGQSLDLPSQRTFE